MFVFELRKQAGWLGTSILLAFVAMAQAQGPRRASVVELLRVLTATGVEVTVNETSSTRTVDGPAGDVRKGTSVLVLGLDNNGTTITADWVVIQPHGDGGAAAAKAHGVIPFESGVPSPAQSVGTIPASYTQGVGTLVSGIQAYIPVAVAQAVFPGGIVDRVVSLSDGSYEVHNISINWPHHVFVSKDFMYLGAE